MTQKIEPLVFRTTIQVEQFDRVKIDRLHPDGTHEHGFHSVSLGMKEEEVEVRIDLPRIVKYMGVSACRNATGQSRDGYVLVKKLRRKKG